MVDSHGTHNAYSNLNISLNDQQHFRLNKSNGIKDFLVAEIKGIELISKKLSKFIASFDYFDKALIVLSYRIYFFCIICNCHWSTCRNNKGKF